VVNVGYVLHGPHAWSVAMVTGAACHVTAETVSLSSLVKGGFYWSTGLHLL